MKAKRTSGDLPLLPATASPGESSSVVQGPLRMDWSNLGDGPAGMIAERLLANDVADYVRFRAVCCPWRRCSVDPRAHGTLDRRFHPRRWIMLREEVADPDLRRLLNVSTGQCVRTHLPELRDHDVCSPTVEGLLLLRNRSTYALRLLNPLTRQVADLPPATTLYPLYRNVGSYADPRLDFEVSSAGLADDATVVVLFNQVEMLAVAKPGDEQWTLVEQDISLLPGISFAGRFYCTTDSDIMMVETRDNKPPRLVVAAKISHQFSTRFNMVHLLNNYGELLLLSFALERINQGEDFTSVAIMEYRVSGVDLDIRKTQPIHDLGGRALFIGSGGAISVSPLAFPTIRNDSVYLGKGHLTPTLETTGPYKLVDGRGTRMNFEEGCGINGTYCFNNDDKEKITRYGPLSIVDYLSQYVTKATSDSFAEEHHDKDNISRYGSHIVDYLSQYVTMGSSDSAEVDASDSDAEATA